MTKFLKYSTLALLASGAGNAAIVNVQVNYQLGAGPYFATSGGDFVASGSGFVFYGTFSSIPTGSSTPQQLEDSFHQLGLSTDVQDTNGHDFTGNVEESNFENKRGYILVTDNADIGTATEYALLTNSVDSDWTFSGDLNSVGTGSIPIRMSDLAQGTSGAEIIIGSRGSTSGFDTIQLTAVPEPSSSALLGLGALALTFRRKK